MNSIASNEEAVLQTLHKYNNLSVPSLASKIGAHPVAIGRICSTLQCKGLLRQTAPSVYTLTSAGEARLWRLSDD
jgi:DNA-binding IclR family transcriptional regulator